MKTKKQTYDWLMALEAERHDQSWKNRPQPTFEPPTVITKVVYKKVGSRERDNIMYQMGRYSAGCRDSAAVHGQRQGIQLINKEVKNA